jgi:hypothetical protein
MKVMLQEQFGGNLQKREAWPKKLDWVCKNKSRA